MFHVLFGVSGAEAIITVIIVIMSRSGVMQGCWALIGCPDA